MSEVFFCVRPSGRYVRVAGVHTLECSSREKIFVCRAGRNFFVSGRQEIFCVRPAGIFLSQAGRKFFVSVSDQSLSQAGRIFFVSVQSGADPHHVTPVLYFHNSLEVNECGGYVTPHLPLFVPRVMDETMSNIPLKRGANTQQYPECATKRTRGRLRKDDQPQQPKQKPTPLPGIDLISHNVDILKGHFVDGASWMEQCLSTMRCLMEHVSALEKSFIDASGKVDTMREREEKLVKEHVLREQELVQKLEVSERKNVTLTERFRIAMNALSTENPPNSPEIADISPDK